MLVAVLLAFVRGVRFLKLRYDIPYARMHAYTKKSSCASNVGGFWPVKNPDNLSRVRMTPFCVINISNGL